MRNSDKLLKAAGAIGAHCAAALSPLMVAIPTASFSGNGIHSQDPLRNKTPSHENLFAETAEVIEKFEGSKPGKNPGTLAIYTDATGNLTACYGRLLDKKQADELNSQYPNGVPQSICKKWLIDDTKIAAIKVLHASNPSKPLTSGQFVALTSLVYNVGSFGETLSKQLQSGDYIPATTKSLPLYNKGIVAGRIQPIEGLTNRREAEVRIAKYGLPGLPNAPINPEELR